MWIVELGLAPTQERLSARPAHRQILASLHERGVVPMAGPLADDSVAVIIFDVADEATVTDLLRSDPYYTTPGVTIISIREWAPLSLAPAAEATEDAQTPRPTPAG
jgi:uncharacterized protein